MSYRKSRPLNVKLRPSAIQCIILIFDRTYFCIVFTTFSKGVRIMNLADYFLIVRNRLILEQSLPQKRKHPTTREQGVKNGKKSIILSSLYPLILSFCQGNLSLYFAYIIILSRKKSLYFAYISLISNYISLIYRLYSAYIPLIRSKLSRKKRHF